MKDEVVKKIIEMIKKDVLSTVIKKEDSEDTLIFDYDNKTNKFSVVLTRVLENGKKDIVEKSALTIEDVVSFINIPEFNSGVLVAYKNRFEKEVKYEQAKQNLIQQLKRMDISSKTRETMQAIIEQVAQLPEYVGKENRVTITNENSFVEELRLVDETNWDNQGSPLHLQLVQSVVDESGTKHHNYPQMTFAELVEYVSRKNVSFKLEEDRNLVLGDV